MSKMSPPRKKSHGRPKSESPMRAIASFKGSEEFARWFDELAEHSRLTASGLIEHSLVAYAKSIQFEKPAPKR